MHHHARAPKSGIWKGRHVVFCLQNGAHGAGSLSAIGGNMRWASNSKVFVARSLDFAPPPQTKKCKPGLEGFQV